MIKISCEGETSLEVLSHIKGFALLINNDVPANTGSMPEDIVKSAAVAPIAPATPTTQPAYIAPTPPAAAPAPAPAYQAPPQAPPPSVVAGATASSRTRTPAAWAMERSATRKRLEARSPEKGAGVPAVP
jgi:hypothetical protein